MIYQISTRFALHASRSRTLLTRYYCHTSRSLQRSKFTLQALRVAVELFDCSLELGDLSLVQKYQPRRGASLRTQRSKAVMDVLASEHDGARRVQQPVDQGVEVLVVNLPDLFFDVLD